MSAVHAPASRAAYRKTLAAACLAVMVAQAVFSLPGVLNGTFQEVFNTVGSQLTWISAAFVIPMVIFELTTGVLGDLFGRRRLLVGGGVLVLIGATISCVTPSVQLLWVGQVFSGLGAAVLFPTSLTMVASAAPTHAARTQAIAAWAGFLSIGAAVAPLLAGLFVAHGSWRGSYLVIIAVTLVALGATTLAQESSAPAGRKLDLPGQVTFAAGLFAILYGLVQGAEVGWGETNIVLALVVGVILIAAFVVIELRTESPLLNLNLFRNRAFAVTGFTAVIGMFAFLGICFSMSVYLGAVQHVSALRIGIIFLFIQGPAFVLAPVVSHLIRSVSPRWTLSAGYLLFAAAGFWLSTFDVHDTSWTQFFAPMAVVGLGFALTVGSLTAVAIHTVPLRLTGMASATTNMLRDLGFALGPVIVGAVTVSAANKDLSAGLDSALAGVPAPYAGVAAGISHEAGALAINNMPVIPPPGPDAAPLPMPAALHELAFTSLGSAYSLGFLLCAISALVASGLVLVGLVGVRAAVSDEELATEFDVIDGIAVPVAS
jgi:MFS family permease